MNIKWKIDNKEIDQVQIQIIILYWKYIKLICIEKLYESVITSS